MISAPSPGTLDDQTDGADRRCDKREKGHVLYNAAVDMQAFATSRLHLVLRTFAGFRTHLQLARIARTRERVPHTVSASQREVLGACLGSGASCGAQK